MVRGSKPDVGEIFRSHPDQPWGTPSLLYSGFQLIPRGKVARVWRLPPTLI